MKEHAVSELAPSLSGYVMACYACDGYCWLGCIIQSDVMTQSVTANVLHPHSLAKSYVVLSHKASPYIHIDERMSSNKHLDKEALQAIIHMF